MTCKQQMVTSDLSIDTSDIKHLSHHSTKACNHTQRKLASSVSSQAMRACFLLASASQVLLTGPRMEITEGKMGLQGKLSTTS